MKIQIHWPSVAFAALATFALGVCVWRGWLPKEAIAAFVGGVLVPVATLVAKQEVESKS